MPAIIDISSTSLTLITALLAGEPERAALAPACGHMSSASPAVQVAGPAGATQQCERPAPPRTTRTDEPCIDPDAERTFRMFDGSRNAELVGRILDGIAGCMPRADLAGLRLVRVRDRWGYVDAAGRTVVEPYLSYATELDARGVAVIAIDDFYCFVDRYVTIRSNCEAAYGDARESVRLLRVRPITPRDTAPDGTRDHVRLLGVGTDERSENLRAQRIWFLPEDGPALLDIEYATGVRWGRREVRRIDTLQVVDRSSGGRRSYAVVRDDGETIFETQHPLQPSGNGDPMWINAFGKWGLVSMTGQVILEPTFTGHFAVGTFSEGLAFAEDCMAVVDRSGKVAFRLETLLRNAGFIVEPDRSPISDCEPFSEGWAVLHHPRGDVWVDRAGTRLLRVGDVSGSSFSEGLAAVQDRRTSRWGYIDTKGALVIPYAFSSVQGPAASPFAGGVAFVVLEGEREAYVDRRGQVTWKTPFLP
jgi:hypothetical protein